MHILVVEDQAKIASNIREFLELQHYVVTVCHNGTEGYEVAITQGIDLIVLDINLPGMDGMEVCRMLRENKKNMPILMLTARAKQQEIVHGLNIGADDYLTKPFDLQELLARVRALLRRHAEERSPVLSAGGVTLDSEKREVRKGKKTIDLSPKEFGLLEFLLQHKGRVQERPRIIEHVWGGRDDLLFSQTVDVHIAYLRRKLGKDIIETVPGKGYVIPDA
jgi:DNA-binding response OmpR family regulator